MSEETKRIRCRRCKQLTRHRQICEYTYDIFNDEFFGKRTMAVEDHHAMFEELVTIFQCLGCETVVFRIASKQKDHSYEEERERFFEIENAGRILSDEEYREQQRRGDYMAGRFEHYYPSCVSRNLPEWFYEPAEEVEIPQEIEELLTEVYEALSSDCRRLAMMGMRSLIEFALSNDVGDQGNFKKLLTKAEELGFLTKQDGEVLYAAFDIGSAVQHRAHLPAPWEIEAVVDIGESLIRRRYFELGSAKWLKASTPQRMKAPKQKKNEGES